MSTRPPAWDHDEEDGDRRAPIAPFWQRLNSFFLFPFQPEPLVMLLLLALAGNLLLLPPPLHWLVLLGLMLGASRYAFQVAALASRGVLHSRDYRPALRDPDWSVLPWKFFAVLLVHSLLIEWAARVSQGLGLLALLLTSALLPAALMVLIQSASLRAALHPRELLGTAADIGWQYLLLCLFLFLLLLGFVQAQALLWPLLPGWLLMSAMVGTAGYFFWVMAALVGYVMYQHHGTLQIDLLRQPDADAPPVPLAQQRDAEISALVQQGQLTEALAQAREWLRLAPQSLAEHRRYHRVLLLEGAPPAQLGEHAAHFIALLLAKQHGAEALQAHAAVQARLADFALSEPGPVLALAEQAWKHMDAPQTLALLRGFDRRFAGAEQIPHAYELVVRALTQGLGRGDKALPVYRALQQRYPQHAATQEAAWVLRDAL